VVTAGNASQISDGGAAVLVMSEERAAQLGLTPIGELVSYGMVAGPDTSLLNLLFLFALRLYLAYVNPGLPETYFKKIIYLRGRNTVIMQKHKLA